jgi:hypothetical protein
MKAFQCACGARIFFENSTCLTCGHALGFALDAATMGRLEAVEETTYRLHAVPDAAYRKCENNVAEGACNWMVRTDDDAVLCQACRLNHVIPDLADPENRAKWLRVENAKRRLVYTLARLSLPLVPKSVDAARGLAFDIKAPDSDASHVVTGHADGLITLNLEEADPVLREQARLAMNERYRTLLGHFRHEVGHYYWDVLVRDGAELDAFRARFGDERDDYEAALRRHYENAGGEWHDAFVSAYARAHPWEDWAETWAHYLHMVDTIETAVALGFAPAVGADVPATPFDRLATQWMELTVVLNELNRSMGLEDAYPFRLGDGALAKLRFVHDVIARRWGTAPTATASPSSRSSAEVENAVRP